MKKLPKDPGELSELVRAILNTPFWIPTVASNTWFSRQHDDTDGKREGIVEVVMDSNGDMHLMIDVRHPLRFRTVLGGGSSERVRVALMILAEAIRLDNEERPIADPRHRAS